MNIVFENIDFRYPSLAADAQQRLHLHQVSIAFDTRERIGIVGKSGAGKTTFLQLLLGLEKPTRGNISVDGENLHQSTAALERVRSYLGLVFQFPEAQLFEHTVFDDLAFGPRNQGWPEGVIASRVESALEAMGLAFESFATRSIYQLSQGEKRRVAIAGILAMQPQMLVLDEPTSGLDASASRQLCSCLRNICKEQGNGLLIASHDLDFLADTVERLWVFDDGRLVDDISLGKVIESTQRFPESVPNTRAFRLATRLRKSSLDVPHAVVSSNQLMAFLDRVVADHSEL